MADAFLSSLLLIAFLLLFIAKFYQNCKIKISKYTLDLFFSRILLLWLGNSQLIVLECSDISRGSQNNNKKQEALLEATKIYNIYYIISDFTGFYSELFKRNTLLDNTIGYTGYVLCNV